MSVILVSSVLLWAQNPIRIGLESVAEHYRSKLPFKVAFTVKQSVPNTSNFSESKGDFCLGPEEQFRVFFQEQEIVYDGQWLWTRDYVNHQVIVEEFNPRSTLKFVSDILNGSLSDYRVVKSLAKAGYTFIDLKPEDENGYIRSLHLQIENNVKTVRLANYQDFQKNIVTLEFDTLIGLNPADSSLFRIDLKKSEELIDLRP